MNIPNVDRDIISSFDYCVEFIANIIIFHNNQSTFDFLIKCFVELKKTDIGSQQANNSIVECLKYMALSGLIKYDIKIDVIKGSFVDVPDNEWIKYDAFKVFKKITNQPKQV